MNRLSQSTTRRMGFDSSRGGRARRARVALHGSRSWIEVLEDRTLLSLDLNNVQNLKALAITTPQNVSITQDVATFNDTDPTAVAGNFTATINWGDSSSTAGIITEDASNLFHVTGTHIYTQPGSFPVIVTIKDVTNGTLYATNAFNQTNLVSSVAGLAGVTDPSLINPWGTSSSSSSPIWVSDQGTGLATLYNPNGSPIKQALTVTIPSVGTPSGPTGQVFNTDTTTTDFNIPGPSGPVPSVFLFDTLSGTIAGWNPASNGGATAALTAQTVTGAVFTGLAQASASGTFHLYAADFTGTTGANGIDVFDPTFTNVSGTTFAGKFTDPNAVAGFDPYNIAFLNGDLFVAYAKPSGIVTTGGGYIDEFDTSGNFINRIFTDTAGTNLKGPWGMAIAPAGFGSFGGDLLVGNFGNATATSGNGTISVISLASTPGTLAGTLSSPNGTISNAGLWSLLDGNGGAGGTSGTLYFTAGIAAQTQGLFGAIAFSPDATATVSATQQLPPNSVKNLDALPISAVQGVQFTKDVATFSDTSTLAVASDFTATINWGDSSTPTAGTITEDAANVFHVTGTHIYALGGSFPITVTIKDPSGTLYATNAFNQTNVVSSVAGLAGVTDPSLINPWGTSSSSTSPIWVSDQGAGLATLYNPNGSPIKVALTVTIPKVGTPSGPTGQVFNADTTTTDFNIPGPSGPVPSIFLFSTLDGTIAGWNPGSNGGAASALTAQTVTGAVFTGLAQASASGTFHLYAADFTGTTGAHGIDVFDPTFTNVSGTTFAGKFTDPNAVAGFDPYNIAFLNGDLFVAYAKPSGIVTTGGGYIDEFDTSGNFISRIFTDTAGTNLKGPWGMAIAPAGFGSFGGDLLVGSFGNATATSGNGTISVISLTSTPGTLAGTLSSPNGTISNAGLWSLMDGNGGAGGTSGTLYFTAGIDGQTQGLLGAIAFSPGATATVAALTPSATQPAVATTEDQVFSGPVASFTNSNPTSTVSEYNYVSIDWGDGTPNSAGTVSQPGGPGTAFLVSGTHTYADSGVNGGIGQFSITVNVHDQDGLTLAIDNTASVADVPLVVTGRLNPASDSGLSNSDDITNVVQPNFLGTTSEPNATVTLYAQATGSVVPVVIGQGVSNANDAWSITANQALANSSYTITAIAIDSSGHTASGTTTIVPTLVIDTVGPKVTNVSFNRLSGEIQVTIQDFGGLNNTGVGLNPSSLIDANNFSLTKFHQHGPAAFLVTSINVTPGTLTGSQLVTLQFNGGKTLRGGHYFFTVHSVRPTNLTGVRDIAGNALDGEFYGFFPSGNNARGGDFIAELDAVHHTIFAPKTVIGTATPVSPPGTLPSNTTIATHDPGSQAHASRKGLKAEKKLEHAGVTKKIAVPAKRPAHHSAAVKAIAAILKRRGRHA